MSDYEVTVKVRNARILRAMRAAGIENVPALARVAGVSLGVAYRLVNVRDPAYAVSDNWRAVVRKIADALGVLPDDLFTERQAQGGLKAVTREIGEGDLEQIAALSGMTALPAPDEIVEADDRRRVMEELISTIEPARSADVLRRRFGFAPYDEEQTLDQVGADLKIGKERVRQIEAKAMRHLKHGARVRIMREAGLLD